MTDDLRWHITQIDYYADAARRDIVCHRESIRASRAERNTVYQGRHYPFTFWLNSAQIWRSRAARNLRKLREHKEYVLANYERRFQEEVFRVDV